METEDAAARVASLGVPCCEAFLQTYSEYNADFGRVVLERLGATKAVSLHCKTQHFESDFFGQSIRQREDAYAMLEGFLTAGQVLGAGIYVYHGMANMRGKTPRFEDWRETVEQMMQVCRVYGIDLCWEVVSWCHLTSPERVRLFRRIWPDLHFVLDTKQVYELGLNSLDFVVAMGDRLRHVHVLDWDTDGRYVLPGKGICDFRVLSAALRESGYAGDVILEPYGSMAFDEQDLRTSLDWLGDVFQASAW